MARKRRRTNLLEQRDPASWSLSPIDAARTDVRAVVDRRLYHPAPDFRRQGFFHHDDRRIPHETYGPVRKARVVKRAAYARDNRPLFPSDKREWRGRFGRTASASVGFRVPARVAVCVRRKVRREVIFAGGFARKGSRARRRRSWLSDVRC